MSDIIIRPATDIDVNSMVSLSYEKRRAYEKHQPQFWRHSPGAEDSQSKWFNQLLLDDSNIILVAESADNVVGFVIGSIKSAPEVYDPGGPTLIIDDFCVKTASEWSSIGSKLITELNKLAKNRGIAQILCVCGAHDEPKRQLLKSIGLLIASEWYVGGIK